MQSPPVRCDGCRDRTRTGAWRARSPQPRQPWPTWRLGAVAIGTLVLWASAFVAIRHLGHDFSPGALSLGRLVVAPLALALSPRPGCRRPTGASGR